jgi:hypothetical protein
MMDHWDAAVSHRMMERLIRVTTNLDAFVDCRNEQRRRSVAAQVPTSASTPLSRLSTTVDEPVARLCSEYPVSQVTNGTRPRHADQSDGCE